MVTASNPPVSQATSQSSTFPTPALTKRSSESVQHRKEEQHAVIKTPPRPQPRSLVDDIDSPGTTATMMTSSPPRTKTSIATFSPKLSPISHASSTTRQQIHRHKQQDLREPPSPFSPRFRKPQEDQQQIQRVENNKIKTSSKATQVVVSQSQPEPKTSSKTEASGNGSDDDDYVDLTDLFVFLQHRDWEKVYAFLKQHPRSSLQTIHSKKGTTSLLHIVLRHGPPLPVVDVLLVQEATREKIGKPSPFTSIWKQTNTIGQLPLHVACSCGPAACLDVISRLILADPDALQVRAKDQHGRYPLHLAVVTNASEEVVMELMIHYPDASFKPDAHGKIPIEYAQDSCYGHNRLVVALELAPMFLAASKAASKRVAKATETKLNSLRDAHASYEEQLEDRYNTEKMQLLRDQIRCSNELTNEKERNIALAENLLETRHSEQYLTREKRILESKLERELLVRKAKAKLRDEELKQILLGKHEKNKSLDGENEDDKKDDQQQTESDVNDSLSVALDASSSELPLPRLLKRISEGYASSKRRNEFYKKSLERQRDIAKNLNLVLAAKENDLQHANRKSRSNEITLQEAVKRAEDLSEKHQSTLEQFSIAKKEVERLKKIGSEQERKYSHSQRRLKIQEKRLLVVQDLIESLKVARAEAEDRLYLIQEEGDSDHGSVSPIFEADGTSAFGTPFTKKPSAAELSLDLSVEIEMAAMAAAQLDDGDISSSFSTSSSARRRAADISVELAATDNNKMKPSGKGVTEGTHSNRETISPESMSNRFETSNQKGTNNNWEKDNSGKWAGGTPQTLSVATATTASSGEGCFGDDAMDRSIPETPPVPKQVKSRSRQEYDQCSPLASLKLDFGLQS